MLGFDFFVPQWPGSLYNSLNTRTSRRCQEHIQPIWGAVMTTRSKQTKWNHIICLPFHSAASPAVPPLANYLRLLLSVVVLCYCCVLWCVIFQTVLWQPASPQYIKAESEVHLFVPANSSGTVLDLLQRHQLTHQYVDQHISALLIWGLTSAHCHNIECTFTVLPP